MTAAPTPEERCKQYGTKECALICLSQSSCLVDCPFAPLVWTPERIKQPNYTDHIKLELEKPHDRSSHA